VGRCSFEDLLFLLSLGGPELRCKAKTSGGTAQRCTARVASRTQSAAVLEIGIVLEAGKKSKRLKVSLRLPL
jgi:hypothetical protein